MALYTSIGVNSKGIRQILSMDVYNSEDEMDWSNFFMKWKWQYCHSEPGNDSVTAFLIPEWPSDITN